ncbi:transposase [Paracoccus alcaliphilus]|uniref:transposase n=1 Tax=Paracoccus alcaliphilus TaxID=34002 RepID=UPI0023510337|nr:transposase [Paracoccus alcaliphilus]
MAKTAICVVSEHGKIVKETEVASEPEPLLAWLQALGGSIAALGLEAGPLSQWLHRGLTDAGLTPSRNQSGERDVSGGITKAGDVNLRRALCQATTVMMNRGRGTWLRSWGAQVAKRRGRKRAMVALARRISVILHRMWIDGTTFRMETAPTT